MSFLRIDDSHLAVPGKMDVDEMAFLAALAALVPQGGHIVEIGPFFGRSTRAMGRANPGARITSFDTFQAAPWTERYAQDHTGVPAFDEAAFRHFTRDLRNLSVIRGASPGAAEGWAEPIDMIFEDAVHGNPPLAENLAFWLQHLKPGGIVCGHDYTRRFPDVKRNADALAEAWNTELAVVGSLWALRRPGGAVGPLTPPLSQHPGLRVEAKTVQSLTARTRPGGYWCGAHLDPDRLGWIRVDLQDAPPGLGIEYRLGHPNHGETEWMPGGTKAFLLEGGRARPFTRIAMRLTGPAAADCGWRLGYRASARQIGRGGHKRSGTSDWAFDGDWTFIKPGSPALNALTAALFDRPPPDAQAAFPPKIASMRLRHPVIRRLVRKTVT